MAASVNGIYIFANPPLWKASGAEFLLKPRNRRIDTGASGSPLAAFRPWSCPKVSGNRRRGLRAAQISVYTPTASRCARGGGRLTEVDAKFFGAVEQGSHLSNSRPKLVTRGQRRQVGLLHVTDRDPKAEPLIGSKQSLAATELIPSRSAAAGHEALDER